MDIEESPPVTYVATPSPQPEMNGRHTPQQCQADWSCPKCTMLNPARKIYCVACFHRHPDLTPLTCDDDGSDYTDDEDDIDEYEKFPSTAERQEIIANAIPINDAIDSSEEILETQGEEDPFHKKNSTSTSAQKKNGGWWCRRWSRLWNRRGCCWRSLGNAYTDRCRCGWRCYWNSHHKQKEGAFEGSAPRRGAIHEGQCYNR
uniref:RanBP2-type domain-containing protein n=1 Tax=Pseudo-nitzschia australis TaxID=44445 RepID=A0A7S4EFK0_9STRA